MPEKNTAPLNTGEAGAHGSLVQALSSGVPLKVVAHVADVLEESGLGHGQFAFGVRGAQLASVALSFEDVFVLQSAASNLLQLNERVEHGLRHAGPALLSAYAPVDGGALPGYLQSAAAMQSRAFPAFSYDPGAGTDLAARFSLENNPQPEVDWPVERLEYADPDLQSASEEVAFTLVDFALCGEIKCQLGIGRYSAPGHTPTGGPPGTPRPCPARIRQAV